MTQLSFILIAFIVANITTIYICRKIDVENEEKKFLIIVLIVAALLGVEHLLFIHYVMSKLRYLDFNFSATRDSFKDALFLASGFTPTILLAFTYAFMNGLENMKWKKFKIRLKH